MFRTKAQRFFVILVVMIAATTGAAQTAGPPQVLKVDPPSWWIGHSINLVRLLIRGQNFGGARVTAGEGLRISATKINVAGTYICIDLQINPQARPGNRRLQITNANGSTEASLKC
jgi:hypothetical protein